MTNKTITYNMAIELVASLIKYVELSCDIVNAHSTEASLFKKLENESYIDFTVNNDLKIWSRNIESTI